MSFLDALLNLIFPSRQGCKLCGGKCQGEVCFHCRQWLARWAQGPRCGLCGRSLGAIELRESLCVSCRVHRPPFALARAVGPYRGPLKEVIHRLKYKGQKSLAPVLAKLMLEVLQQHPRFLTAQAVIAVPASRGSLRERGFNQAELLAEHIARELALPMLHQAVVKSVETPHQTGLSREARLHNLEQAFCIKDPSLLEGKVILLVDDVFTTGATASTLGDNIMTAGAAQVYVITAASS